MGEALTRWHAFNGDDDPRATRAPADYSDQRFAEKGSEFNVYCCRAKRGDQSQYATAISSKVWGRLRADPTATGQR
eukprot:1438180-Lingulodinium_polyedra.AAC.1